MSEEAGGSVVDSILAKYGFEWKLNPYRIVVAGTSKLVQEGPHFDLRHSTLRKQKSRVDSSNS